jgi:hypothetical protein
LLIVFSAEEKADYDATVEGGTANTSHARNARIGYLDENVFQYYNRSRSTPTRTICDEPKQWHEK